MVDVVADSHAVVWFEYLGRSKPGIGRIVFGKLFDVVGVPDEGFEIEGLLELANLDVLVREKVPGLQK